MEFNSPQEALQKHKDGIINEEQTLAVIRAFPTKLEIPSHCFQNQTQIENIAQESSEHYEFEGVDFNDQIKVKIKGAQFPIKTFVDPDTLAAANIAKSVFIESVRVFSHWSFIPAIISTLFSKKRLQYCIEAFNRILWRAMSHKILKQNHQTDFTNELNLLMFTFLCNLGIQEFTADKTATMLSHLFEYDNAYRLRMEDVFSETSVELLQNPFKELGRLSRIFAERDINPQVITKIQKFITILRFAMLIPKVKKAFLKAIDVVDIKKLGLDEVDTYWLMMRKDYNALGLGYEARQEYAKQNNWVFPQQI